MKESLLEIPVVHIDETLSLAIRGKFLLISWFGVPKEETIDAIFEACKLLIDKEGVCCVVMILEDGATPPSPELRSRSTSQHDQLADRIDCYSILIPRTGFKASIMAIVAKAMQRSTRNLWKQCIRQTEESLVTWLAENAAHKPSVEWLEQAFKDHRALTRGHRKL